MSNFSLKVKLSTPQVELPRNKSFDKTLEQARQLADDIDDAAAKQVKALRRELKAQGVDVAGAERSARQAGRELDKLGQRLREASPLRAEVSVSRDQLELSGSLRLPEAKLPAGSRLQQDLASEGPPRSALFALNGFSGFIGGMVTGAAIASDSGAKMLVGGGLSALGISSVATLSSRSLERRSGNEFEFFKTLGVAGAGYVTGIAVGIGIAHLARGRMGPGC